jgi:hypothetical protein
VRNFQNRSDPNGIESEPRVKPEGMVEHIYSNSEGVEFFEYLRAAERILFNSFRVEIKV